MKKKRKVGLALGSGGARGFCHLGILEVLTQNNIPIDLVSGCSMGALIGACFCAGVSVDKMVEMAPRISQLSIMDVNISARRHGLLKGERAMRIVKKLIGDMTFEDCGIPFVATATEARRGRLVQFTQGRLIDAVRASISIPIAFHAVEAEEDYLVDGGVLERIPIPELKEMGADVIIAVDALGPPAEEFDFTEGNGFMNMIERTYLLLDWEGSKHKMEGADLLITPEQGQRSPFLFKDNEYSIEQGRQAALKALPEIRALLGIAPPEEQPTEIELTE